ncbi:MAG: polysaccharide pyruvyl transferase family protein [Butyrivibrio sp.]|nr:polysaccharide pyruvyl transferase family protein [Butyrivibrio sp.]
MNKEGRGVPMAEAEQIPVMFYMHAGSGNHGCEAIAGSTCRMLYERWQKEHPQDNLGRGYMAPLIVTNCAAEDLQYSLGGIRDAGQCMITEERHIAAHKAAHVAYYLWRKLTGDQESFQRYRFQPAEAFLRMQAHQNAMWKKPLAVSIGGDNYCYPEMVHDLALADHMFRRKKYDTVLMGCSIEPDSLKNPELLSDLQGFRRIIARESITFEALLSAGIPHSQLALYPDPAFLLRTEKRPLPEGFIEGDTVGINLSPMVQRSEKIPGVTMESYRMLIRHILKATDYRIALIPHVVWPGNDDRQPLHKLFEEFSESGRIIEIPDHEAEELKGFIARCRLFIGARTHATIAAYSSCVPTLVLGYSVKSRGIATDLFGTDENYVLPVQKLENPQELSLRFDWLDQHQNEIRSHLIQMMPEYTARARGNADALEESVN